MSWLLCDLCDILKGYSCKQECTCCPLMPLFWLQVAISKLKGKMQQQQFCAQHNLLLLLQVSVRMLPKEEETEEETQQRRFMSQSNHHREEQQCLPITAKRQQRKQVQEWQ